MMCLPDGGVASGLYHIFLRTYYESKKRGEQNNQMLMLMGGSLTFIVATMALNAFCRMHRKGPKGRMVSRRMADIYQ